MWIVKFLPILESRSTFATSQNWHPKQTQNQIPIGKAQSKYTTQHHKWGRNS
jgi:hypothetical protein